ncbi:Seventh homolog of septin 1 AltName: Full=Septation protein 7 [Cyberlindnera jadinii]|uniref:Septin-type G domain-containing protein n=1 Tax=Cyberlindnera jadinii (strain ATCC 18201 / CBS 1600 / BCRC 20928 / JCM 3617 / NBRC 0987 / NRRL Y-1542) TaxID=983966 RepID=A0A0H5CE39_CYBJN|nr:Seventh homolog of septin 1 AltName: Full=Septation protein 7 [Cyberlindnera jadinii]
MWKKNQYQSPEEIRRRKNIKKGIDFTLLVCGQEGTGKASFINTLCNQNVIRKDTVTVSPENSHLNPGIDILDIHVNIAEKDSTPISLDVIMAPGFGDNIDNTSCVAVIVNYLELQFDLMLNEECRIDRDAKFKDGRPHALFTRVNVIPVLAKLDSLTQEELTLNKQLISKDIELNGIPVYDFSIDSDDPETITEIDALRQNLPFAICGSYDTEVIEGSICHVRRYPWGTLKVEDPDHSDFTSLRNVLFGSHLQELKDTTHTLLYENYRRSKLATTEGMNSINSRVVTSMGPTTTHSNTAAVPAVNLLNSEPSLLNLFNSLEVGGDGSTVIDEETLREIERKKKLVEAYMADLNNLESRLRHSSKFKRISSCEPALNSTPGSAGVVVG